MIVAGGRTLTLVALLLLAVPARADELADRVAALEEQVERLHRDNAGLRRALTATPKRVEGALLVPDGVRLRLRGYGDVGFFKAAGDGVAYVRDAGKAAHPELGGYPWVFLGDPWGNPINTQGDSADLGGDRNSLDRFDAIASGGKPTFIANLVNLTVAASLGAPLLFKASVNFEPRPGRLGSPGDVLDVDLMYLQWRPFARLDLSLYGGKIDSAFGIEYRARKAPERFGVTPSLIARYTVGTPIGIKVRGSLFAGLFTYALAVTNGSTVTERFGHLQSDLDQNFFKTVSGRLSLRRTFGAAFPVTVEIGGSGLFGAQDQQPREDLHQWQAGADLQVALRDLTLRAEYLRTSAPGGGMKDAPRLQAQGPTPRRRTASCPGWG
jgi:hypothetical protein